jgi:uncharacterized protein YjbI with pentapeptide repeats
MKSNAGDHRSYNIQLMQARTCTIREAAATEQSFRTAQLSSAQLSSAQLSSAL